MAFATWVILYVASIGGGRRSAVRWMHGFMDVSVGIIVGIIDWVLKRLVMPEVKRWIAHSGWSGTSLCFRSVRDLICPLDFYSPLGCDGSLSPPCQPTPVSCRRCPCFEDATAVVSVILGIITRFWYSKRVPTLNVDLFSSVTPTPCLNCYGV